MRADGEVVLVALLYLVATAQDFLQFLDGCFRCLLAQCAHGNGGVPCLCRHTLHHRGVGCYEQVVLIHAPVVVALGLEYAHDAEGDVLESDVLAYAVVVLVAEELLHHRSAHEAHLGVLYAVLLGEAVTLGQIPFLDFQIVGTLAIEGGRGVLVAIDDLSACAHFGRDVCYQRSLSSDGLHVLVLQCLHAGRVGACTGKAAFGTRTYGEQVGTHLAQFCLHVFL